jgi:di/tricarboxylate transporter
MGWDAWFTLVVVLAMLFALVRDLVSPVVAVVGAMIVLLVSGVITPEEAFAGFSNSAPITVAALYVLARAVEVTGALDTVVGAVLGSNPGQVRVGRQVARLVAPVAGASAFLNNTPIVAMAAPQVASWARQRGRSAAPLLMPLSFAAILGGLVTSIGTSTNLVVSGLLTEAGRPELGLFEITRAGLPVAALGLLLIIVTAPVVLRGRGNPPPQDVPETMREFSVAMQVEEGGPLDAVSVEQAGLRHLQGVYLVAIDREDRVIAPVAPDTVLAGKDVLRFVGKIDQVVDLQRMRGLSSTEAPLLDGLGRQEFFEVVLGADSRMVGHTLKDVDFRSRYEAVVLAVHRAGQRVDAKLGELPLRAGDTLLMLADPGFRRRWRESGDFLVVARIGGTPPGRNKHAPLVLAMTAGLVLVAGAGLLPILQASLVVAILLVATRVLTVREARESVDLNVILVIAAAFGVGAAVDVTGLADQAAELIVGVFAPFGKLGALAGILITTVVMTEMITNNAAAVLMFPVAVSTAATVGSDVRPFAIAVAIAASASFLTPIGYQTNTMVYGLGGYKFSDYLRLGAPLTLAVLAVSMVAIPMGWGL